MQDELPGMEPERPALNLHNGTYTVEHPKHGHFTVKLYTAQRGELAGRRILAMLVGPDNVSNYRGVAFWLDEEKRANVWKRFRGPDSRRPINGDHWQERGWSATEKRLAIWSDLAIRGTTEDEHGFWYGEGYRLLLESVCAVCNRKLTHPESIKTGIGPECREKQA